MRALVVSVALLALLALLGPARADARPKRPARTATATAAAAGPSATGPSAAGPSAGRTRLQSIGAPWSGQLRNATRLRPGERYHLRRPHRTFGTRTTVEHVRRAIVETLAQFPKAHALAIGDLSAEAGGWITEHRSHQTGRDVDLGLFYRHKPAAYPASFVDATDATLHRAATWALLSKLAATASRDGGAQIIFLDYDVQGLLYRWAKDHGVSAERLAKVFQYPRGRGAAAGLVRHEPNHANHIHVRFKCAAADARCR